LIGCAKRQEVRLIAKTKFLAPDPAFYAEPVDSGLREGMSINDILTALTLALGQANNDRRQILEYVQAHVNPHAD